MALVLSGNDSRTVLAAEDIPSDMPTTGPDLNLQLKIWAGIQIVWPFLRDPGNSPICAATVHKMTRRLLSDPGEDTTKSSVRILRTQHQSALDALLHFVAIPRPQALLEALEWKLNQCECDLTISILETCHENDNFLPWTFKHMIGSIFQVLADVMDTLKVGHVAGSHAAVREGEAMKGKWPSNTASFFPTGPEEAIISFTTLYRLTRAPSILNFIRLTFPHCPSLAFPAANTLAFFEVLVEKLQRAVDRIDTDLGITGIASEYPHHPLRSIVSAVS